MRILIELWIAGINIDCMKRLTDGNFVYFGFHAWVLKHNLSLELYES